MENVKFWTGSMTVEDAALKQLADVSKLPILAGHIAVMPDVHMGVGACVGSVIPTDGAVIPSAVGVDIGCGMAAVRTTLTANDLPASLAAIRAQIERDVPVGFNWHKSPEDTILRASKYDRRLRGRMLDLKARFEGLAILANLCDLNREKVWEQIGTLGGGNHFIEICLDTDDRVWLMLHSGSRNVGNKIGQVAITQARELMVKRGIEIPNKDLGWLPEGTPEFEAYITAMTWAQDYAALNRDVMMELVIGAVERHIPHLRLTETHVNCHHNFTQMETHYGKSVWITRKGAVEARPGQLGIIPGSMGSRSYIVEGKGDADSYCSCSHGAGRTMSRTQAKRQFTVADLAAQTMGVECRKDVGILDEIPGAYKSIDEVMAAQRDLVDVIATLKAVLCVKG
jgi:tRNA-splicing ligase RtcB (3'-phosphate/5'-hydroxy nucleic acid ligase)